MKIPYLRSGMIFFVVCGFLSGCTAVSVRPPQTYQPLNQTKMRNKVQEPEPIGEIGWTERRVTRKELLSLREKDKALGLLECYEILGRLNIKSASHISGDVRGGAILKVPNDFRAYKGWSPLPKSIPQAAGKPKLILIVKDIPFVGWYERGELLGDSQICIGRKGHETLAGKYPVLEKDADHYSKSYKNDFGSPAGMPWAMRIYDVVWIHGGDVTEGYCSPGCVYLPVEKSEELFRWTEMGTDVLIVESLTDLEVALR